MHWLGSITVALTIIVKSSSFFNIRLVKDYTQVNGIAIVLLISCEMDSESIKIESISNLQHDGLWTNVWDISIGSDLNNFDYHKFFDRYSNPLGVVINLQCNQTKDFMREMSKRILFHHERKWLMISESLHEAFDILNQEHINFDAEIVVAIPLEDDFYDIYEVYNPSYSRGGWLNITLMGRWSVGDGWNQVNQTKIERRHDLNGITFPTVVPVSDRQLLTNHSAVHIFFMLQCGI